MEIDQDKLNRAREIPDTTSIRDTIEAAFHEVISVAAVRDLVALAEGGAFGALLEPDAEEKLRG